MTSRDFCYWLQGFFEITGGEKHVDMSTLNRLQVDMIKNHLNMVFKHEIDPSFGDEKKQAELNKLHSPTVPVHDPVILRC